MNAYQEGMLSTLDLAWLHFSNNTPQEKLNAIGQYLSTLKDEEVQATVLALISAVVSHMELVARSEDMTVHETIEYFREKVMEGSGSGNVGL